MERFSFAGGLGNKMNKMRNDKKGQQEIVGFVLIVVLVVVGLMVFLIISTRTSDDVKSVEVGNMLDALMKHTTDCAVVYEPDYDDFEDLFKSCHQEDQCSNLGLSACDYLNESLRAVLEGMFATEATVGAYQIDFLVKDDEGEEVLLRILEGNCTGSVFSAQRSIVSHSDSLVIRLKVCSTLS